MGFFNTLGEIAKNQKQYKAWEKSQHDKQAQLNTLNDNREFTEQELAEAQAQGKKIIEIIDVMDNHSESVSENVETATAPLVGILPAAGMIGAAALSGKFLIDPAEKEIKKIRRELEGSKEAQNLYNKIHEYNKNNKKNKFYIDNLYNNTFGIGDAKRKAIKDVELRKEVEAFSKNFAEKIKGIKNKKLMGILAIPIAFIGSFIGGTLLATKLQVDSSKVARYQARESLKDAKNFVTYTPEQIAQAKAELEAEANATDKGKRKNKKEKEKLNQGFFKSIYGILRDRRDYLNAKKTDTDDSKIVTRELTEEEIKQAQRDKDVIQRTVKLINNEAEKYSENMEVAAGTIIASTPILGAAVGGATTWILNKFGVIDKWLDNTFNNKSEEVKKVYNEMKALNKERAKKVADKKWNKASWVKYQFDFIDLARQMGQVKETASDSIANKKTFFEKMQEGLKKAMVNTTVRNRALAIVGGLLTGLAGLILGLKLQKASARAGRYTAKRELEKDPRNFIGYSDEEYNSVSDVKNDKKPTSRFKEVVLFIPNVIKQYIAYEKYKKTEFKEQKELQKQLLKQDVTNEQLQDAVNLQRKLFNTFEKVDDNSQIYSESMEAATEMAQPFVMYGAWAAVITPFIVLAVKIAKGKISINKVLETITDKLGKSSKLMNSKLSKKYLNGVADNVELQVSKEYVSSRPLAVLLKDVKLTEDSVLEIFKKSWKNLKGSPEKIREADHYHIYTFLDNTSRLLKNSGMVTDNSAIIKVLNELKHSDKELAVDVLDVLLNGKNTAHIPDPRFNRATAFINKHFNENITRKLPIAEMLTRLNNSGLKDVGMFFEKIIKQKPDLFTKEEIELVNKILKLSQKDPADITRYLEDNNTIQFAMLTIFEKMSKLAKEMPEMLKNNPEFKAFLSKEIQIPKNELETIRKIKNAVSNPQEMKNLFNKIKAEEVTAEVVDDAARSASESAQALATQAQRAKEPEMVSITMEQYLKELKDAIKPVKNYRFKDLKAMIPDGITNPKMMLESFETKIKDMSPEEFEKLFGNMAGPIDRETLIKIIPNLKKIVDNIPKEELSKIADSMIKAFEKNPDEFVSFIKNGGLSKMFFTPEVKTAMAATGISWGVFIFTMTYAIESWLADMQLKAGRLGVMKSLEDLEDYRYYANVIKDDENA